MWPKYFMTFAKSKGGQEGARRIEGGADDLFVERHCLCEIYGKNNVWKRNFQYKNDWYTLQKCFLCSGKLVLVRHYKV